MSVDRDCPFRVDSAPGREAIQASRFFLGNAVIDLKVAPGGIRAGGVRAGPSHLRPAHDESTQGPVPVLGCQTCGPGVPSVRRDHAAAGVR